MPLELDLIAVTGRGRGVHVYLGGEVIADRALPFARIDGLLRGRYIDVLGHVAADEIDGPALEIETFADNIYVAAHGLNRAGQIDWSLAGFLDLNFAL